MFPPPSLHCCAQSERKSKESGVNYSSGIYSCFPCMGDSEAEFGVCGCLGTVNIHSRKLSCGHSAEGWANSSSQFLSAIHGGLIRGWGDPWLVHPPALPCRTVSPTQPLG